MTITDYILVPPPNIKGTGGRSDSILVCSIIFKNNDYPVVGRKFSEDSIYWEVEEMGFAITSNQSPIVFSFSELDTLEISQIFNIWHEAGINLLN